MKDLTLKNIEDFLTEIFTSNKGKVSEEYLTILNIYETEDTFSFSIKDKDILMCTGRLGGQMYVKKLNVDNAILDIWFDMRINGKSVNAETFLKKLYE